MIVLTGIGVSPGVDIGKAYKWENYLKPQIININNAEVEIERFRQAVDLEIINTLDIAECIRKASAKKEADVFTAQAVMIKSPELYDATIEIIKSDCVNAEFAIWQAANIIIDVIEGIDDEYMSQRASDIRDICQRICTQLKGETEKAVFIFATVIVACKLMPSDIAGFDLQFVKGIVMQDGGSASHAVILARTLGIPAVVGVAGIMSIVAEGATIALNGDSGRIIVNPDESEINNINTLIKEQSKAKLLLERFRGFRTQTADGIKIELVANIANISDAERALANDCEGIGLFRTEFLYIDRKETPGEDEQIKVYESVAKLMGNKPVIIRTLDIGGDKDVPYLKLAKEENPYLGLRAIRLCLKKRELFSSQLKALLRAAINKNIRIMFPMITVIDELIHAKELVRKAQRELASQGVLYAQEVLIGMMVETPAAAMLANEFAEEVDFFSIGTNDLTQYTLAVDRGNQSVADLYSTCNPSVLKLIAMTASAAHQKRIPVGICGEAASDSLLLPFWVGIEISELSVSPGQILRVRSEISQISNEEAHKLADDVLKMKSVIEVEQALKAFRGERIK
ncbi:MAG: phosphoenolpyruvate--protein phosphotransferase [Clostridiales bacterium GWC2_40_7]|nr:MAG: phosphoenolpyruvate--protein phosphotransferase [Clostridiales bacterium GWC2_40_7]